MQFFVGNIFDVAVVAGERGELLLGSLTGEQTGKSREKLDHIRRFPPVSTGCIVIANPGRCVFQYPASRVDTLCPLRTTWGSTSPASYGRIKESLDLI